MTIMASHSHSTGRAGVLHLHPSPGALLMCAGVPALATLSCPHPGHICLASLPVPEVHCPYQDTCQLLFLTLIWLLPQLFACWLQRAWTCYIGQCIPQDFVLCCFRGSSHMQIMFSFISLLFHFFISLFILPHFYFWCFNVFFFVEMSYLSLILAWFSSTCKNSSIKFQVSQSCSVTPHPLYQGGFGIYISSSFTPHTSVLGSICESPPPGLAFLRKPRRLSTAC